MLGAHRQAMTDGEYVYISTDLLAVYNYERRWMIQDSDADPLARQAFQPLLQASRPTQRRRKMSRPGGGGYRVARDHDGAGFRSPRPQGVEVNVSRKNIAFLCILSGNYNIYCGCRQRETVQ